MLATFTVTNVGDSGTSSLRQAILGADADTVQSTIRFSINTAGVQRITPHTPLPALNNAHGIILDGTTEPGFTGTPLIVIDGTQAGNAGLVLMAGNSTVKGLVLDNFVGQGIGLFVASDNNTIQGNFLGTDATGTAAAANGIGIYLAPGSSGNTIGGTTAALRNLISGNLIAGIQLEGTGTTDNLIQGNFLGTNAAGTLALGNASAGVVFDGGASANTLGGTVAGAGNTIAGNGIFGVVFQGSATCGNVLQGNAIGTNGSNAPGLGNGQDGVALLAGASNNTIGGTAATAGNTISGNHLFGVLLAQSGTSGNVVQGNLLGTDATGTVALANTDDGVAITAGASGNTVGGTATGAGNVAGGNGRFGIFLLGTGTTGNVVQGNLVGLPFAGTSTLANAMDGIALLGGASGNTLGGSAAGAANFVANNARFGVFLAESGTTGNVLQGNTIGLNRAGTAPLANTADGVAIVDHAAANTVGGTATGAANVIAGNGRFGVMLESTGTTGNLVMGNAIGTNSGGTASLGNMSGGVLVQLGAAGNTVGGTASGAGNTIAFNNGAGVTIGASSADATAVGNSVLGNSIFGNNIAQSGRGINLGSQPTAVANGTPGAGRTGPNNLQNRPVFTTVGAVSNDTVTVTFTFGSLAGSAFRLEFFLNLASDTVAQGRTFLGAVSLTTDANGDVAANGVTALTSGVSAITVNTTPSPHTVTLTLALPTGTTAGSLTATATAVTVAGQTGKVGDTSEFSAPGTIA